MKTRPVLCGALLAVSACAPTSSSSPPTTSSSPQATIATASPPPDATGFPEAAAPSGSSGANAKKGPTQCRAEQFVACKTGPACTRKGGELLEKKTCFDRAADACAAASCAHGCNIHNGSPKEVHCAPNASSSGNMKECAGFANWGCPENTTCKIPPGIDDAKGICIPSP
jgi:hypothetical protein